MTYSELLHSVDFDDLIPYIKKYHGGDNCLAYYKIHYDSLCHLTPKLNEEATARHDGYDKVEITNGETDAFMPEPHLHASHLEGDYWESGLAKELDIASDVDATKEEMAACCLWHTSFYGFTKEQVEETGKKWEYYDENLLDRDIDCIEAQEFIKKMQPWGIKVSTRREMLAVPSFHVQIKDRIWRHRIHQRESRKWFGHRGSWRKVTRRVIQWNYYKHIKEVAPFVVNAHEAMDSSDLSKVFTKNGLLVYCHRSYSYDANRRALWMIDLIDKYKAFNQGIRPHYMMCIGHSPDYPLTQKDYELVEFMKRKYPGADFCGYTADRNLGQELSLSIAFYK